MAIVVSASPELSAETVNALEPRRASITGRNVVIPPCTSPAQAVCAIRLRTFRSSTAIGIRSGTRQGYVRIAVRMDYEKPYIPPAWETWTNAWAQKLGL